MITITQIYVYLCTMSHADSQASHNSRTESYVIQNTMDAILFCSSKALTCWLQNRSQCRRAADVTVQCVSGDGLCVCRGDMTVEMSPVCVCVCVCV